MGSLQRRLSAGLFIVPVILVVVILAIGHYALRHLMEEFVASRLEHDMEALLVGLRFNAAGRLVLDSGRVEPIFRQPYSGHYYKVRTDEMELRSRSLWDADLEIPNAVSTGVTRAFTEGPGGQELLVLARIFKRDERPLTLAVGEDFTPLAAGLWRLTLGFVLIALVLLAALILGQRFIVRQGLKPLENVRRSIPQLARGEIRLLDTEAPIEIRPLVEEINRLIELMEQRLVRSRHALGNLAHALKGPLTVLTQLAEHRQVKIQGDLCGELERQTSKIRALMERELKRARIAGGAMPGQRVLLGKEIADLVDTLKKIHREKHVTIRHRIPEGSIFSGERDDLLELLGNLLDNACKWAVGTVRMTVQETDAWQTLTVEDDGPGCSVEELELLTRRGSRIDESRAGHGLGLAIVEDIVAQYGGQLRLRRSEDLGGFTAEVELPRL